MKTAYVIASILPAAVAFFWSITLLSNRGNKGNLKRWLGLFMTMALVLYSCHALVFLHEYQTYFQIKFLYQFAGLSVYPLFYNYLELMSIKKHNNKRFFLHLIPAFVISIVMLIFSQRLDDNQIQTYIDKVILHNDQITFDDSVALISVYYTFKISRIIYALQVIVYTYLSFRLIKKYRDFILNFYSNIHDKNIKWLQILVVSMLGISVLGFVFNIIGRSFFTHHNLVYIPSIVFSILLYFIGLQGNQHVSYVEKLQEDLSEEGEDIPADQIEDEVWKSVSTYHPNDFFVEKLMTLIQEEKVFLNSELKITDISQMIGTNRTYVSQIINENYQMHFNDFINYYRIQYARDMIHDSEYQHYSFAAIAESSGFGSLSTFNRSFKKFENCTPQDYKMSKVMG